MRSLRIRPAPARAGLRRVFLAGACAALFGCGGHGATSPSLPAQLPANQTSALGGVIPDGAAGKIKHIVIIFQENRTFDGLFHGFAGSDYAKTGKTSTGKTVTLTAVSFKAPYELCHDYPTALADVNNGAMDGFDKCAPQGQNPPPNPAYKYVSLSETTHYFTLAKQYSLADEFFSSQLDGSFISHQYIVAAQAGMAINVPNGAPWGCDASPNTTVQLVNTKGQNTKRVFPCFTYNTIAKQMDAKSLPWRFYAPTCTGCGSGGGQFDEGYLWSSYDAIKYIRNSPEWTTNVVSQCNILTDAPKGDLPTVSWVIPDLADSDHPLSNSTSGPKWVTAIVNAIGQSPLWSSTAIFVTWDDWGGFYDHVAPPTKPTTGFAPDWDGPGFRVPMIAISPYTKQGTITHKAYDGFAALLKTVEGLNGLTAMTPRDTAAQSLFSDTTMFDFNQTPRAFKPITNTGYTCNANDLRPNDTDYGVPMYQNM